MIRIMKLRSQKSIGIISVLIASFGFGTMPAMAQRAFQAGMSSESLLAFRFIIAVILIWTYVLARRLPFRVHWQQALRLLSLGVLSIGVGLFLIESYHYIPGGIASLTTFSCFYLIVSMQLLIGRQNAHPRTFGSVLLASAGIIMVVWNPQGSAAFNPLGILLAFLAAFCNACLVVGLGSKKIRGMAPEIVIAYTIIPAVLFNVARGLISRQPLVPGNTAQLGYGLYIAVFSTVLAFLFFFNGVRLIGGSNAALVNMTEPLVAYAAGVLLMSDVISTKALAGGLMVIAAIVWLNINEKHSTPGM